MSGLVSTLTLILGIISLQGYILFFAVVLHYIRFQHHGSPSSTEGALWDLSARSTERVVAGVRSIKGDAGIGSGDDARASRRCPNCDAKNEPSFDYCHNCVTALS